MNRISEEKREKIAPDELAFDIDGVFADTFRVFVETAKGYGVEMEYEDLIKIEPQPVQEEPVTP